MKKINQNQIIGIAIVLMGITASLLSESVLIGVSSGMIAAVGVGLILKWIPFKKSNS